jgi:hypothetical protein
VLEQLEHLDRETRLFLEAVFGRRADVAFSASAIASQLTQEVGNATKKTEQGLIYAPDQFTLSMHPTDIEILLEFAPQFQTELANRIRDTLTWLSFRLVREPHITLATDPTVNRWEVRVFAWRSSNPPEEEAPPSKEGAGPDKPPKGAFLIVEGKRHFPLEQDVVRIGRRQDNDLILSDPHVSRVHSELRLLAGRYVLVDMGSTGGTYVNGRQVKQHILDPGDVISIAVVQLIYGEDVGGPPRVTPPYSPPRAPSPEIDRITPHYLRTLTEPIGKGKGKGKKKRGESAQ